MPMIKNSKIVSAFLGLGLWASASLSASASDFVFDLVNHPGQAEAYMQVTVHQQSSDTLRFTVDQLNPTIYGDLRGLFFHINESIINPADLTFNFVSAIENDTFNPISASTLGYGSSTVMAFNHSLNNVNYAGSSSNNMNGVTNQIGYFDIGVEFGSQGASPDDIKSFTFDISRVGGLDQMTFMPINKSYFMGGRVMSLRGSNGGSSKLTCCGPTTVAEPEMAGLLTLAFGMLMWRRRFSA